MTDTSVHAMTVFRGQSAESACQKRRVAGENATHTHTTYTRTHVHAHAHAHTTYTRTRTHAHDCSVTTRSSTHRFICRARRPARHRRTWRTGGYSAQRRRRRILIIFRKWKFNTPQSDFRETLMTRWWKPLGRFVVAPQKFLIKITT